MTVSLAPQGFKGAYERAARSPVDPVVLSDLLALVGYEAKPDAIERWSLEHRVQAEVYAVNVHLRASDNVMRKHPRPGWMPEPWRGPESRDEVAFGPGGTPLEVQP